MKEKKLSREEIIWRDEVMCECVGRKVLEKKCPWKKECVRKKIYEDECGRGRFFWRQERKKRIDVMLWVCVMTPGRKVLWVCEKFSGIWGGFLGVFEEFFFILRIPKSVIPPQADFMLSPVSAY